MTTLHATVHTQNHSLPFLAKIAKEAAPSLPTPFAHTHARARAHTHTHTHNGSLPPHNFTCFVKQETGVSVAGDYGNSCWYVVTVHEAKKRSVNSGTGNTSFSHSFFVVSNTLLAMMQINYSRPRLWRHERAKYFV